MGADLQRDTNEIWVVHVSESLPEEEIDVVQQAPVVSMGAALLVAPRVRRRDEVTTWTLFGLTPTARTCSVGLGAAGGARQEVLP